MNNFCIATCIFSATKLSRDNNKNFGAFIGGCPVWYIFLGVYSQCKSKTFSGGSRWKMIVPTPNVGIVHM
jgi:hypothetical protein